MRIRNTITITLKLRAQLLYPLRPCIYVSKISRLTPVHRCTYSTSVALDYFLCEYALGEAALVPLRCGPMTQRPTGLSFRTVRGDEGKCVKWVIVIKHYCGVIMTAMKSRISSLAITRPFIQLGIKENIKAPRHWPLCGEFTGDRWIPHTKASNAENVSIWWRHHQSLS